MMDPLTALPAEIVLRIIDFLPIASTASLTQVSSPWHQFIDTQHQSAIYSSLSKVARPPNSRSLSSLAAHRSFTRYYEGLQSWKDLCKRQTLLHRNWHAEQPVTRESVTQVANVPVWRFRVDFKRRFIVSTSQAGGLYVTDMDDGKVLWKLADDEVRQYAHLEYDMETGTAVWDCWGNDLEVWKADEERRGVFAKETVLRHEKPTRGYQLSHGTLCVVSSEGIGWVYDMRGDQPRLKMEIEIQNGAGGHLDQNEDTVLYSMGEAGYDVHDKETGECLGSLIPKDCTSNHYHIKHPTAAWSNRHFARTRHGPTATATPESPRSDRLVPLKLETGKHPSRETTRDLEHDEWGAGMFFGNFMVGISKGGRVFICSDWRGALKAADRFRASSTLIECETDEWAFDMGGWLSIKNGKVLWEVGDHIYIFPLTDQETSLVPLTESSQRIYATLRSSAAQFQVPISFMAVWDDCIMHTYEILHYRRQSQDDNDGPNDEPTVRRLRAVSTIAIRTLSFAPDLNGADQDVESPNELTRHDIDQMTDRLSRPTTALELLLMSDLGQVQGIW